MLFGLCLFSFGVKIEGIKLVWKGMIEVGSEVDVDKVIICL